MADIPLRCSVCPKKPDFSDVSHLLTHVSSKGHLSAEHKLRIRDDDASKEAIEDYDDWVETYNIKELVRERLNQKEKKSRSGGATSRRSSTSKKTLPSLCSHVLTDVSQSRAAPLAEPLLRMQLKKLPAAAVSSTSTTLSTLSSIEDLHQSPSLGQ